MYVDVSNGKIKGIKKRLSKVWADERRRLSGARRIKTSTPAPKLLKTGVDDDDQYEEDLQALNDSVDMQEAAEPSAVDPSYALIEKTWYRRHLIARSKDGFGSLLRYFGDYPFMSAYRMVCMHVILCLG